ncbi:MAG: ribbon-helix-helix protein, CopG family [Micromonosporaceae bacterium]|nr:ribbon-helix-helix protein, CopG family [Micromonosporaceae bacterium]
MPNVLVRDVPEDVLAAIDAHASRLGLSRSEYVRRQLSQDAERSAASVTSEHLRRFAATFGDLSDPDVMAEAWR